MLIEGVLRNIVEECKLELSTYEWIGLNVMEKMSLINMRNRVGDNTQFYGIIEFFCEIKSN